ncbi:MAG: hypothetical protein Q4A06_08295 [Cardiobacteriaceae bacterium]|nr:hypothetical protein [Cardiobacteriaceae bacterium]
MKALFPLAFAAALLGGCFGSADDKPAADAPVAAPAVDLNDPQAAGDAFMQMIGRDFLPTCNPEPYFAFVAFPKGITPEQLAAGKQQLVAACEELPERELRAQDTLKMKAHGMAEGEAPGTIVVHYRDGRGGEIAYPFVKTAQGWKYPFPF